MIGLALSFLPRSLLIPAAVAFGIITFYEGLPFASYVPFVGSYFVGRVGHAFERGQAVEALAWEDQRRRDQAAAEQRRLITQNQLDALEEHYLSDRTAKAAQIADLEAAIEQERADNAAIDAAPAATRPHSCPCNLYLSRRLRDQLQVLGRNH